MSIAVQNRNTSFKEVADKLPKKRKLIYNLIKENEPCTRIDLSVKYNIPINEVSGRFTELKEECLIVEVGSKTNNISKKENTTYRVVKSKDERIDLVKKKMSGINRRKIKVRG
ncbi:MAG: hypothetical protein KGV59_06235 [Tenacibaculum sp.]|nr:hypothetical protein [Tenacibaculum sp.]